MFPTKAEAFSRRKRKRETRAPVERPTAEERRDHLRTLRKRTLSSENFEERRNTEGTLRKGYSTTTAVPEAETISMEPLAPMVS